MITRLAILGVAAVVLTLVAFNRRLHNRLQHIKDLHADQLADARTELVHTKNEHGRETASLARRNHELELALSVAQGTLSGLRMAAQDAYRLSAERIAANEREMAELRLAAQMLWTIHERETYPEIPIKINGTKRSGQRKALAARS